MLHAFFCYLHLLLGHALQGLCPVLVHVDVELIEKVFGLFVLTISAQDVAVLLLTGRVRVGMLVLIVGILQKPW